MKAPGETAQHGAGHIQTGDFGDAAAAPALTDIGHAGGEHHRDQHAFDKAPDQQLVEAAGTGRQQRRQGQEQGPQHYHRALLESAAETTDERCGDGNRQGGEGDAPAHLPGAGGEALGQFLENALGGIEVEKGRTPAEKQGDASTMLTRIHETSRFMPKGLYKMRRRSKTNTDLRPINTQGTGCSIYANCGTF